MFRRHRGAWGPEWRIAFALVPVVVAAGVLLSTGDRPPTGSSRLEANHGPSLRFPGDSAMTAAPDDAVATSPVNDAMATTTLPPGQAGADDARAANPSAARTLATTTTGAATAAEEPTPVAGVGGDVGHARAPANPSVTPTTAAAASQERTTTTVRPPTVGTTMAALPPEGPVRSPGVEAQTVALTNDDRAAQGLGTLARHGCLDAVASGYAERMARSGVMAHDPAAGSAVTGCRPGAAWGDNVGTAGPCSASLLEQRWIVSPPHRRNILSTAFRHLGVGSWTDATGTCWVQVLFSS